MSIGIDITFFEPASEDNSAPGRLYIDDNGKDYLEFAGNFKDIFKLIKVLYAKPVNFSEKYTLMNCVFKESNSGIYRFLINELYKGDFLDKVFENSCIEVEAKITGLTNWINHPRIKPELSISSTQESKVVIKEFYTERFIISANIRLEITEHCGEIYSRNETILRNRSFIKFVSTKPIARLELYKNVVSFLQLLSLFTNDLPKLIDLNFSSPNGKTVEFLSLEKTIPNYENEALLTYDILENVWPQSIKIYYAKRAEFSRVLELLIASIENITAEISFLNITTAFEVFHKYFYEKQNIEIKTELEDELIKSGLKKVRTKQWDQVLRYYHLFRSVENIGFFKNNFRNIYATISLIRDSRNYYTHYTETEKQIWTPNQLLFANKALRQLIKAVILKELLLPDALINRLLNNRSAVFYQDYEKNEYSLNYLQKTD